MMRKHTVLASFIMFFSSFSVTFADSSLVHHYKMTKGKSAQVIPSNVLKSKSASGNKSYFPHPTYITIENASNDTIFVSPEGERFAEIYPREIYSLDDPSWYGMTQLRIENAYGEILLDGLVCSRAKLTIFSYNDYYYDDYFCKI